MDYNELYNTIDNHARLHVEGFTSKEVSSLCNTYGVSEETLWEVLGVHSAPVLEDGTLLTYTWDIANVITHLKRKNDLHNKSKGS